MPFKSERDNFSVKMAICFSDYLVILNHHNLSALEYRHQRGE